LVLLRTGAKREPLGVLWMAAALAGAAFLGGALGLVWQSVGLDEPEAGQAAPAGD
jgi:hypothetical protein